MYRGKRRAKLGRSAVAALAVVAALATFPLAGAALAEASTIEEPAVTPSVSIGATKPGPQPGVHHVPVTVQGFDRATTTDLVVVVSVPDGGGTLSLAAPAEAQLDLAYGYDSLDGRPAIGFSGSKAAVTEALASNLMWASPLHPSDVALSVWVSAHTPGTFYNPANGHYYRQGGMDEVLESSTAVDVPLVDGVPRSISWTMAEEAAAKQSLAGMQGYLATITSAGENDFVSNYVNAKNVWIGASDAAEEGTWRWVTGPESGTPFWTGANDGAAVEHAYASWNPNEPNNYTGTNPATGEPYAGEHYAVTNWVPTTGEWNDVASDFWEGAGRTVDSFLIEFGGMEGDDTQAMQRASASAALRRAPSSPRLMGSVSAANGATVFWQQVGPEGDGVVVGYTVTATDGELVSECTVQVTEDDHPTECALEGLVDGAAYEVTVTATNEHGTSRPSQVRRFVHGAFAASVERYPGTTHGLAVSTEDRLGEHFGQEAGEVGLALRLGDLEPGVAIDVGSLDVDVTGLDVGTETMTVGGIEETESRASEISDGQVLLLSGPVDDLITVLSERLTWSTPSTPGVYPLHVAMFGGGVSNLTEQLYAASRLTLQVVPRPVPAPPAPPTPPAPAPAEPVTSRVPVAVTPEGTGEGALSTDLGTVAFQFSGAKGAEGAALEVTVIPRSDDQLRDRGITAVGERVDVTAVELSFEKVEVCVTVDVEAFERIGRPDHRLRLLHLTDDGQEEDITTRVDLQVEPPVVCGVADSFSGFEAVVFAGDRLAGDDRYATAAAVATELHPDGADTVYVASAEHHPDAVVAGRAAADADLPLLLTSTDDVPQATLDALQALAPARVVVVGGRSAVSEDAVDDLIRASGVDVERIAGADRYSTAAAVARDVFPDGAGVVYLATGSSFPDALAAGAAAHAVDGAVLLTAPDTLPSATAAALEALAPEQIVIVGGEAAVSAGVESAAKAHAQAVTRAGGADRYGTAGLLAQRFEPDADVVVATGEHFADALVATTVAGRRGAPVVLSAAGSVPEATRQAMSVLRPARMVIVGGALAVDSRAELDLIRMLPVFDLERL